MAQISIEVPRPRRMLARIAIIVALSSPVIQIAFRPLLENYVPYPLNRFLSLWVFWIAVAFALFISVHLEGISLAVFGITKNNRSLRYRLIEMIAALLLGLVVTIVIVGFSGLVRNILNIPLSSTFDPQSILPLWVMFPAWITATFTEEFLFRSYPIERLTEVIGNRWLASTIAALAFIILHLFAWDWVHVLTIVVPGGIILTGIYLWRKSLWFVVVIHAVVNLPVLLLPLIAPYL